MKALKPDTSLLCKLGSIAVHAQEFLSSDGHDFDRIALTSLLEDPAVKKWIAEMDSAALVPKMRKKP